MWWFGAAVRSEESPPKPGGNSAVCNMQREAEMRLKNRATLPSPALADVNCAKRATIRGWACRAGVGAGPCGHMACNSDGSGEGGRGMQDNVE